MDLFGYGASLLMGLSLGLIGGGGSILSIPILVYLFAIDPVRATGYSLFIVGTTALVGGLIKLRKGEVDLKVAFAFGFPSFVGIYLTRAWLVPMVPDTVLSWNSIEVSKASLVMVVFALLMLGASVSMLRRETSKVKARQLAQPLRMGLILLEGLVVGAVTGFVGAGGGFLIIPALVVLVGLPMRMAIGTSLLVIAVKSLIGFVGDIRSGADVDWSLLLVVASIAIVGLFFGILLSRKVSDGRLKSVFGYFVLVMGAFVLFDQLH